MHTGQLNTDSPHLSGLLRIVGNLDSDIALTPIGSENLPLSRFQLHRSANHLKSINYLVLYLSIVLIQLSAEHFERNTRLVDIYELPDHVHFVRRQRCLQL
jgi:hypothetical protein